MSDDPIINWIREGLAKPGKTQRGLAVAMGVSEHSVSRMLRERDPRRIKADELAKIESYLGSPVPIAKPKREQRPVTSIPVLRIAAPGVWREHGAVVMLDRLTVPAVDDPRASGRDQFAVQIEGQIRFAICVDLGNTPARPSVNEIYLVERRMGSLVETTLQRVAVSPQGIELHRVTTNGAQSEVIHSFENVRLVALVIGFFEPA